MTNELMEVRCCCQPKKLLGYLPVPRSNNGNVPRVLHCAVLMAVPKLFDESIGITESVPCHTMHLPIEQINIDGSLHFAIKAEGMTIEKLSLIRGFIPA